MAIAEADPGDYLDDEDRKLVSSLGDSMPDDAAGPVPGDIDEIAPEAAPLAAAAPVPEVAAALDEAAPVAPELLAAAPPPPSATAIETRNTEAERIAAGQGVLDKEKAAVNAATAERMAQEAQAADEDARLERAEYLDRKQQAEQDLDAKIKRLEDTKITPPERGFKSVLSVIFGGLGAAFRSAGGGDSKNTALALQQQKWENDTQIQKANIAAARDSMIAARTRLADVNEGRRQMTREADARLVAKYNMALRQGEAQLKNQGIPQAQLDADARILKLRQGRDAALARTRQEDDAHALNQARINRLNAQAAKLARRGTGAGGVNPRERRAQEKHDAFMADRAAKGEDKDTEKTVNIGTERTPAQAPTKKSAEEYRVFESSAQQVEGALEMLAENYKKYGVEISSALPSMLQSDAARERAAIMESIVLPAKEVGRLGALAGPDKSILVNITGGNAAQFLGDDIGIKGIRAWLGRARKGALNSLGINPEDPGGTITLDGPPSATPATMPARGAKAKPKLSAPDKLKLAKEAFNDPDAPPEAKRRAVEIIKAAANGR